jgi:hypothetical protein
MWMLLLSMALSWLGCFFPLELRLPLVLWGWHHTMRAGYLLETVLFWITAFLGLCVCVCVCMYVLTCSIGLLFGNDFGLWRPAEHSAISSFDGDYYYAANAHDDDIYIFIARLYYILTVFMQIDSHNFLYFLGMASTP